MRGLIAAAALLLSLAASGEPAEPALSVRAKLPILPVVHGITQEIEIELSAPDIQGGDAYEVTITAESGMGVLLAGGAPSPAGSLRYRPGEPQRVAYRWAGPLPTEFPVTETVTVAVAGLGLSAQTSFDVGVNLDIAGVRIGGEGAAHTPVESAIADTFHPDADIAAILSALGITPEIRLDLVTAGNEPVRTDSEDLVVTSFLGEAQPASNTVYPGSNFEAGRLVRGPDGSTVWRSLDGRSPGVSLSSPGEYAIVVTLKSNAGGIGLKEKKSEPFEIEGREDMPRGVPEEVSSTIRILRALGPNTPGPTAIRGI
jgi:hypothetical protein